VLNISKIQTESNSQLQVDEDIHPCPVVLNISKIQTESNSQHNDGTITIQAGCAQYFKDTN